MTFSALFLKRKIIVIAGVVAAVAISVAAIEPSHGNNEFKNLKVLPKDISTRVLQQIMDDFQDELGVGCNFCHAKEKASLHLDYASDEKPEKEIARSMMLMTMDINKKYFAVERPLVGDSLMIISCNNCHHGIAHPDKDE